MAILPPNIFHCALIFDFSGSHSELSFSLRLSPSPFGRLTPLMHLLCLITTMASVMRFIFSAMLSEW